MLRVLAVLLACGFAASLEVERQGLSLTSQPLQAAAAELSVVPTAAGLQVSGLRFRGCPQRSLAVLLLDGAQHAETVLSSEAPGPALDFDRTFDRGSGSWVLGIGLPVAGPRPVRLELWCRACRSADGSELSGQLSSQPLEGGTAGVLVVLLQGATLPGDAAPAAPPRRRALQQSAGGCTVAIGGTTHTFASCSRVGRSNSFTLTVHSSVEPGAGGAGAVLRMGMVASVRGGWASFGLPQFPGTMIGADAVILYPTADGAEVAGFKLTSTLESVVNKAKGTFPLSDAAAEASNGELRAVFAISLPNESVASAIGAGGVSYIFALGPMGDPTAPGLSYHSYDFGSGNLVMKAASAAAPAADGTAAPASPPPVAATPTSASPPPAAATSGDEEEHDQEGDDHGSDDHGSDSGHSSSGGSAPSSTPAAADASGACELQLGVGATPSTFAGCRLLGGVGSGFWLMWKAAPSASSPGRTRVTLALNTSATTGYVAVGFPTSPGVMVGASAMVLAACSAGADCAGGARLSQFYLGGQVVGAVVPDTRLAVSNIQAAALPAGLAGSFDFEVDSATAGRRLLLLQEGLDLPLIYAAGPATAEGSPLMHDNEGMGLVPALDASSTGAAAVDAAASDDGALKAAHAWLAAIGWGVLVPAGIVMARSFKDARPPLWFHLHRAVQTLGFVLGTVALGLGFALVGGWSADSDKLAVHRNLGVACTALGATQFTAIVLRPAKGQKYRLAWQLWHAWVGRGAAVVAIANIYYGILHIYDELGAWAWASYTAVLAVIVGISVVKDTSDFLRRRRERAQGAVQLTKPASLAPRRGPAFGAATADVEAQSLSTKPSSASLKRGFTPGSSAASSFNGLPH